MQGLPGQCTTHKRNIIVQLVIEFLRVDVYMWQSRVEIEHYSVAYLDYVILCKVL